MVIKIITLYLHGISINFYLNMNNELSIVVKSICKKKGITLAELANMIHVPASSLTQIIKGNPTLSKLEDIAAALGVNVSELFEPKKEEGRINCPYCGREIKIKAQEN